MNMNPLLKLESFDQSIWMDFIRRGTILSGELKQMIAEDGVTGITSNPSIFEKAITGSHDYDQAIRTLTQAGKTPAQILEELTIEDIQGAADLFRPTYARTQGRDGFVSLEVSPHLAHDTAGTITEARHLWKKVNRPNVMIKVPGTKEGIPAVRQLISESININITLLFGLPRYREIAKAYLEGLEDLAAQSKPLDRVASVASFFLSRIDVLVDPMLDKIAAQGGDKAVMAIKLQGMVAIYSAKVAYDMFHKVFKGNRFNHLAQLGACPQRLLWASTSTKNPKYSDVMYVEALIGPETIDTLPIETIQAYKDHGKPLPRLAEEPENSCRVREQLNEIGIDLDAVTQQLEDEGVEKFNIAFDQLLAALTERQKTATVEPPPAK